MSPLPAGMLDGKRTKRREIEIQRAILQYLAACRIVAWQNTTGAGVRIGAGGNPYKVRFGVPGQPDLEGLIPRKLTGLQWAIPLFIEVKRPGEIPKPHQEQRMRLLRDADALVFVATCIEDVARALDAAGVKRL